MNILVLKKDRQENTYLKKYIFLVPYILIEV